MGQRVEQHAQVSVVVVVRNGERYLADAIRSIQAQSYRPCEILVVDGQSTDQTAQIARSFREVRYLCQPDLGLANARNYGIAEAQGNLVAFLDHDDLWTAHKLRVQVDALAARAELEYVTCYMQFVVDGDVRAWERTDGSALDAPRAGSTPSALMARRQLFESRGGFDPAYAIGCDADWFARMRDFAVPTVTLAEVLVYKRLHQSNLSTNAARNRYEMMRIAKQSIARQRQLHE